MRKLLIDTDVASDDAVALIMAMKYPNISIEAITVVAGNVPLEQAVQNALYTVELCEEKVPIYQGISKPILRALKTAQFVHGEDGMGDIGLDLQGREPNKENAIDVIIELAKKYEGELEIVTLGPLTNIAVALLKEPSIAKKVKSCTIMGGVGVGYANITPVAEFNMWADPEAAKIVFESEMKITMVGWDISRNHAFFGDDELANFSSINTKLSRFSVEIQKTLYEFATKTSKLPGFDLPDPIAMAVALDNSIARKTIYTNVEIIVSEGTTRGQTVVDHNNIVEGERKCEIVIEASRDKFLKLLYKSMV